MWNKNKFNRINIVYLTNLFIFAQTKTKIMKIVNYGKELEKHIKKHGITITHVSKKLGIKRPTLYNRFKDGEFSKDELIKVKQYLKELK